MEIGRFNCKSWGTLTLQTHDIELLFKDYKDIYKEKFSLNNKSFIAMKDFKIGRGGCLFIISKAQKVLAMFTISNAHFNYAELGDLMKIEKTFPRESFAKVLNQASSYVLEKYQSEGIYVYPNQFAVALEKGAGYEEICRYSRNLSLIIFGVSVLLPIEKLSNKFIFKKDYFSQNILRRGMILSETRLRLGGLRIFKKGKSINSHKRVMFGLLYEFIPKDKEGDVVLVFGDSRFNIAHIGFEYCDNSA